MSQRDNDVALRFAGVPEGLTTMTELETLVRSTATGTVTTTISSATERIAEELRAEMPELIRTHFATAKTLTRNRRRPDRRRRAKRTTSPTLRFEVGLHEARERTLQPASN
jgi:hypothetical protein